MERRGQDTSKGIFVVWKWKTKTFLSLFCLLGTKTFFPVNLYCTLRKYGLYLHCEAVTSSSPLHLWIFKKGGAHIILHVWVNWLPPQMGIWWVKRDNLDLPSSSVTKPVSLSELLMSLPNKCINDLKTSTYTRSYCKGPEERVRCVRVLIKLSRMWGSCSTASPQARRRLTIGPLSSFGKGSVEFLQLMTFGMKIRELITLLYELWCTLLYVQYKASLKEQCLKCRGIC